MNENNASQNAEGAQKRLKTVQIQNDYMEWDVEVGGIEPKPD